MKKTLFLFVAALSGCSSGTPTQTPNDPALAGAYQEDIKCASAAVGAGVTFLMQGKDSTAMQEAAISFSNKAIEDGRSLGKSEAEVLKEIESLNVPDGPKKQVDAAMKAKVEIAESCIKTK
jgi:hypothetical protein